MNLIAQKVLLALLPLALVMLAVTALRVQTASGEANRALSRLSQVQTQIDSINRLHSITPHWAQRGRPTLGQGGLATAVNDVLAAAGVPGAALSSLSPAAESPAGVSGGGTGFTAFRRRAVLTLSHVTLPQAGAVLKAWRECHPDWIITSLDITPEPTGRKDAVPAAGGDLPLRAVIGIETLYVEPTQPAASPGASR